MAPGGYPTPCRIAIINVLTVKTSEVVETLAPLSYVTINMPYISMTMCVYHTYPTFAVPRNTPLVTNKIFDW